MIVLSILYASCRPIKWIFIPLNFPKDFHAEIGDGAHELAVGAGVDALFSFSRNGGVHVSLVAKLEQHVIRRERTAGRCTVVFQNRASDELTLFTQLSDEGTGVSECVALGDLRLEEKPNVIVDHIAQSNLVLVAGEVKAIDADIAVVTEPGALINGAKLRPVGGAIEADVAISLTTRLVDDAPD